MNRFKSLKAKLIVCISAIIVLTAVLNVIVGIFASYQGITQNVNSDLKSVGETASVAISSSLDNMKKNIQSVARSNDIGKIGETHPETIASLNALKRNLGYQSLSLVTQSGDITSGDPDLDGKNIADQEYFKKAMKGDTYLSGTVYDINKKLCVIVCAPVSNEHSFRGVVMATIDPQVYSRIINNIVIGKTGNVFMMDKAGIVIANVKAQSVESRKVAEVHSKVTAGSSGITTYWLSGSERICYYAPIPNTDGWSYGAVAPIQEMTSSIWMTAIGLLLSSLVCIVVGIFLSLIVTKSIANPITVVCRRLELLASGDLQTDTVQVTAKDETGSLASSLNKTVVSLRGYILELTQVLNELSQGNMRVEVQSNFNGDFLPIQKSLVTITDSLNDVLSEINGSSDQIASGSEQVSSGAQGLAQGASEQASSIEELSATISEISDRVKSNASQAEEASTGMEKIRSEIDNSNNHMNEMISAMGEIDKSSNQIGNIIKTIEDIAFQTNILALNAAVEAARAGDAGKGFAVVADEVRNLASKSSEAAKNTAVLIESTMKQVGDGTKIVDETAKSLFQVVGSIEAVSQKVKNISEASASQANAVGQVTTGVDQIASVVQTNSATAEESAAASEELSAQAQALKTLVGKFQLRDQGNSDNNDSSSKAEEDHIDETKNIES